MNSKIRLIILIKIDKGMILISSTNCRFIEFIKTFLYLSPDTIKDMILNYVLFNMFKTKTAHFHVQFLMMRNIFSFLFLQLGLLNLLHKSMEDNVHK